MEVLNMKSFHEYMSEYRKQLEFIKDVESFLAKH